MTKKITVKNTEITLFQQKENDYISLTDIAKHKNPEMTGLVISHWLSTRYTVEFLGIWEQIHNPNFNITEFSNIKNQSGANGFVLSGKQWIEKTKAIGLISKTGRYGGGTFAHKDIAFEFASWISAEFKLYLIKEFQRLKTQEQQALGWDVKRFLVKANYKVHADAIKENLIPNSVSEKQKSLIYADEADVLNLSLFSMTAKEWRERNPHKKGNLRDDADIIQLVCLAGLESLNAEFIRQKIPQSERLRKLNRIAIVQMRSLTENISHKQLN